MMLSEPTTRPFLPSEPANDIVVLISGGVDSSVCALILKERGFNLVGVTMNVPSAAGGNDLDAKRLPEAEQVCAALDIPHYYLDVRECFEQFVIEPFRNSYMRGDTPSPCVDCNAHIKFGVVWDLAQQTFGTPNLATGHYARVIHSAGRSLLARGKDHSRDQSYFLYGISSDKLVGLHLPLCDHTKEEIRQIAQDAKLPVARKLDSMELCFAEGGDYRNALGEPKNIAGDIVDADGNVLGRHNGIHNFTIGQRRGIGVPAKDALYVLRIEPESGKIVVGDRQTLFVREVKACCVNVLMEEHYREGNVLSGMIRSGSESSMCRITEASECRVAVKFENEQYAPAPGQRLVLYDAEERVVAGGVIQNGSF